MYDVKLMRPNVSSIIAGPYDTEAEAQMHATRLGLDFEKKKKEDYEALAAEPGDDLDKALAKRTLDKYYTDSDTKYEVVPHIPGGIR